MLMPDFWDDQQKAQGIINELNGLKDLVNEYNDLQSIYENLEVSYELVKEEPDEELREELESELTGLSGRLSQFELAAAVK